MKRKYLLRELFPLEEVEEMFFFFLAKHHISSPFEGDELSRSPGLETSGRSNLFAVFHVFPFFVHSFFSGVEEALGKNLKASPVVSKPKAKVTMGFRRNAEDENENEESDTFEVPGERKLEILFYFYIY